MEIDEQLAAEFGAVATTGPATSRRWTIDELNALTSTLVSGPRLLLQCGIGAAWWIERNVPARPAVAVVELPGAATVGRLDGLDVVVVDDDVRIPYWGWRIIVAPDKDDDPDAPPVVRSSGTIRPDAWMP